MPSQQAMQGWRTAEFQLASRNVEGARLAFEKLLDEPDFRMQVYLRLSQIASRQGRYRDAVEAAVSAFKEKSDDAAALAVLARRLAMLGETRSAIDCAMDPAILRSADTGLLMDAGELLAYTTFPEQSLVLFERARSLGLKDHVLNFLVGLNSMYAGDFARAEQELESCLRVEPDMGVALWALSKLNSGPAAGAAWVDRLQAGIGKKAADAADMPLLKYTLFRALDRRGDVDAAWQALSDGMRLQRQQVRYDPNHDQALFDHLCSLKAQSFGGHPFEGPQPIFIVGMPRSGTTLLERILGNHPDVYGAGEFYDLVWQLRWMCDIGGGPYLDLKLAQKAESIDFVELGQRYLSHTQWRARGRAFYVDKMPANFLNVSYILRAMPQARILHMVRGPMDTCFSNLKECFANGYAHSNDQLDMADHYRRYAMLMSHWHALYPGRVLDVRYDDLVIEPERMAREVLEFCGLPWISGLSAIESRTDTVATASAMQVREPIHTRFLQQWRRYERYLEPMRKRLGEFAD